MDKLAKVRAEIERLYNQSLADENRQADRGLKGAASVSYGKSIVCKELLSFIDSMPKENVWRKNDEEPEDKSKAVVCQLGDKSQTVFTLEYNKSDKNFHLTGPLGCEYLVGLDWPGIRWAYPEDLLPTK